MYRFLLSPRWIGLAIFVVVMFGACLRLGEWQYDRYHERQAANDITRGNYTAEPVPVQDALADGWSSDLAWQTVTATGTFDPQHEVTVRFAHRDSRTGVEVVTPLVLTTGETVLVQRGWSKADNSGSASEEILPPPTGQVTITGWLQPDSTADSGATKPLDLQVRAIDSTEWDDLLGVEPMPGFIAMTAPQQDGLEMAKKPDLGSGPSFFYSIQWYFFAGLALFGYFWFVRTEVKERRQAQARLTRSA